MKLTLAPEEQKEWRENWRAALGAAIGLGTGIALYLNVSSLFITRFTSEFGWSRGDLSLAGAAGFLAGALSLSIVGRILDRIGFRPVVCVCVAGLSLVYIGTVLVSGSYAAYLVIMLAGGIFGAGTGAIAYTRPIIAAFDHGRGFALGVAACGTSLTAISVPPLMTMIVAEFGWRSGFLALTFISLVIGLPLALWLIGKEKKAGSEAEVIDPDLAAIPKIAPVAEMTLREAVRTSTFWLLALALVCINIPGAGIVGQMAPMLTDKGLSETATGWALSSYATGLLLGRLGTGFALDRFPPSYVAAVVTGVPALGVLLLLVAEPSFALAAVALAMIGAQQGSEVDLLAYFTSRRFGYRHYSSIFGAIATAGAISTASGLVLFGMVHDTTGNYDIALLIGATTFLIGACAFMAAGRRR